MNDEFVTGFELSTKDGEVLMRWDRDALRRASRMETPTIHLTPLDAKEFGELFLALAERAAAERVFLRNGLSS
jgi:hypothetical protein